MDLKKEFPVNAKLAEDGVPVPLGDATFYLSYGESTRASLLLTSKTQQFSATMSNIDAGVKALRVVLKDDVVKGWKNLKEDGVLVEYSKENLERMLEEYVGLDTTLMNAACDIANFNEQKKEEIEKNS